MEMIHLAFCQKYFIQIKWRRYSFAFSILLQYYFSSIYKTGKVETWPPLPCWPLSFFPARANRISSNRFDKFRHKKNTSFLQKTRVNLRDWVYTKLRDAITINANIRTKSCPKFLLVFVSLICYNNLSIKYIYLKSHFFGKLNHEVYNWSIGWSAIIFLSLARLQASHNVGSHTAHIILLWDILFWTQSRVELPGKYFFLVRESSSTLPCV